MSTGGETRKGRAHSLSKHVFSVYGGACPVPRLCSLILSQEKKNQMRSFLSKVHLEAGKSGWSGAPALGPALAWARVLSPDWCKGPASCGLSIPTSKVTWKAKMPPRCLPGRLWVQMREAGHLGGAEVRFLPCFHTVCVSYPGATFWSLSLARPPWANKPAILELPAV